MSIYVILQPYHEDSIIKTKQRFTGVILGVSIYFIVFSFIRDYIPQTIILFLAFTGYFYFKDYSKKVIMTTTISLVQNIGELSFNRFMFVVIGIFIALLFNKYFLPYNIQDSIEELKNKYEANNKLAIKEIEKIKNDKGDISNILKLSLDINQIENKLIQNSSKLNIQDTQKFIFEERVKFIDNNCYNIKVLL